MDLHLYLRKNEIKVRAISDGYGATVVAREYIDSKKDYFARTFTWQNGWIPDLWNIDRDEVIGKFFLINCNVKSKAIIGLPYCYLKPAKVECKLNSLLVLP